MDFFWGGGVEIRFLNTVDKTSLNLLYYKQQEGLPNIAKWWFSLEMVQSYRRVRLGILSLLNCHPFKWKITNNLSFTSYMYNTALLKHRRNPKKKKSQSVRFEYIRRLNLQLWKFE